MTVKLENVVESPIFSPGDGALWESSLRKRKGLWADISGEEMTITLPSSSIRDLPDPSATMHLWDKVVRAQSELAGRDESLGCGQWAITDRQPSAGYMHSGYPIVTHLDVANPKEVDFLLNGDFLKTKGMWGMFHEIGHMNQESSWTWIGAWEVTCNIFALYCGDVIAGIKPWDNPWLRSGFPNFRIHLINRPSFHNWKLFPHIGLGVYAQLARDFGWDSYKAVFRSYIGLSSEDLPKNDDEKVDQWITRFSKQTGKNLCPMFDFWGFVIRPNVLAELQHLPPFMPDDETTNDMAPNWTKEIMIKYDMSNEGAE